MPSPIRTEPLALPPPRFAPARLPPVTLTRGRPMRGLALPERLPLDCVGNELPIEVTIEGLGENQQAAVLSSFPGARRFTLARN